MSRGDRCGSEKPRYPDLSAEKLRLAAFRWSRCTYYAGSSQDTGDLVYRLFTHRAVDFLSHAFAGELAALSCP